ncbi:MAG: MBL fold metallo-hydrolase, partial [Clostridia bacterium]|nr:MBL fold metallo-hydrolase [Clostridia bacterium]
APESLKASDLKLNVKGDAKLYDKTGTEKSDDSTVTTGDTVKTANDSAIIIVNGDVNGTGTIDTTDYIQIKRHVLGTHRLEGAFALAADIDGNGKVDTSDFILLKRHLLKIHIIGSDFTNENLESIIYPDDIDPSVPGKQGNKFLVVTDISKYANASYASALTPSTGTVSPGVYYIYNKYPDGYAGVFNITTDPTGGSAGFWVNPLENFRGGTAPSNVLYQLSTHTSQQSMCYVIRTKEDKLIMIDSGNTGDGSYVINFLKIITGKDVPHVDAWFFTHLHGDHTNAFYNIAVNYPGSITVDKLYYTFVLEEEWYTSRGLGLGTLNNFKKAIAKFPGSEKITMVEGDTYIFDDYKFDVLLTMNSGYEIPTNYMNNTSTVMRMTIGDQTVLFLGNAGVEEGEFLLEKYGSALKSDFVQMAHHGQAGVEKDVYEAIAPTACLWTAPAWLYNNTSGKYKTLEVRAWMEELGVKYHFIDKDGLQTIQFPYVFN